MKYIKVILCLLILLGGFHMNAQTATPSDCLIKLNKQKQLKKIVEKDIELHKECSDILYDDVKSLNKEDIKILIKSYKKLYDYYKEEGLGEDKNDCNTKSIKLKELIKNL